MTQPEYRLVARPQWRSAPEGRVDLLDPRHDRWIRIAGWSDTLLHGIVAGEPIAALVERIEDPEKPRPKRREARVRRFVWSLAQLGYLDVPLEAPEVFADRYERVKELGRGGIGVAFLCRDRADDARVVVKRSWDFLQPRENTEPAMVREAEVLARLDHAGIVRMLDRFVLGDRLHIVREFVDGEDLGVHTRAPVKEAAEARRIAAEVASILGHLHARGMLFIDLRPENFVRLPDGRVKLIDVGQVRDAPEGRLELPYYVGSPGYTSPEMLERGIASVQGDIWGLGRLYFFLVTGILPPREARLAPLLPFLRADDARIVAALAADAPHERPNDIEAALAVLAA